MQDVSLWAEAALHSTVDVAVALRIIADVPARLVARGAVWAVDETGRAHDCYKGQRKKHLCIDQGYRFSLGIYFNQQKINGDEAGRKHDRCWGIGKYVLYDIVLSWGFILID